MDIQDDHLNTISLLLCIFGEDVRAVALFPFHKKMWRNVLLMSDLE